MKQHYLACVALLLAVAGGPLHAAEGNDGTAPPPAPPAPSLSALGNSLLSYFTPDELDILFQYLRDSVSAELFWRADDRSEWTHAPMVHHGNDRWTASFRPLRPGRYVYGIEAWTDEFATWRHATMLKKEGGHYMDHLIRQLEKDLERNLKQKLQEKLAPPDMSVSASPYTPKPPAQVPFFFRRA